MTLAGLSQSTRTQSEAEEARRSSSEMVAATLEWSITWLFP